MCLVIIELFYLGMQIKTEFFSQSKVIVLFNKTFLQPIKVAMIHSKFADMSVFTKVFSAIARLGLTCSLGTQAWHMHISNGSLKNLSSVDLSGLSP